MKQLILSIVISISATFLTGCAKPCFYQAGKNIEQCERDLLQCIDQAQMQQKSQVAQQVRSCMQAKGYECMDMSEVAPGTKRITVMASFGTYWALDGRQAAPHGPGVAAQEEQQQSAPETAETKPIGYRARLDENGKHTLIPVYAHEQAQETDSAPSASGGQ